MSLFIPGRTRSLLRFFLVGCSLGIGLSCIPVLGQEVQTAKSNAAKESEPLEEGFSWLFNGKDFTGWEGNLEWFRVEDESVVAGKLDKPIPHNEFLCTKEEFGDFELKLQARLKGENAGIQFRTVRIPNHTEVSGYQCDMGMAWDRPVWGSLYDESRRNKMLAEGDAKKVLEWLKPNDWNDFTIRTQGDRIQLWLNGHLTVDYQETDKDIVRTGIIGLQIHSGQPAEAWYRKIRIKKL